MVKQNMYDSSNNKPKLSRLWKGCGCFTLPVYLKKHIIGFNTMIRQGNVENPKKKQAFV
jgi:hypothetical protein